MTLTDYLNPDLNLATREVLPVSQMVYGIELSEFKGDHNEYSAGNGFLISSDGWMVTAAHNFETLEGYMEIAQIFIGV